MAAEHPLEALVRLSETLRSRAETMPEGSYTTRLMKGGVVKIGEKVSEESGEMLEAAEELESLRATDPASANDPQNDVRGHFVYECGDLLYHTMVLLANQGVDLSEVADELARREGTSGLQEKANRGKDSTK
ncbi:MAG: phosphoribosyl-ATP diphosphatase [Planctomycetota bacterium]